MVVSVIIKKACIPYLQGGANHTGPAARCGDYSPRGAYPYLTYRRGLSGPQIPDQEPRSSLLHLRLPIPYRQGGAMTAGGGLRLIQGPSPWGVARAEQLVDENE